MKGRWQKIGENPTVICDTGHNTEGIIELVEQIKRKPHRTLRWVFGMVKEKAHEKVLATLPTDARYYFCQAKIPRAMDAGNLFELAAQLGLKGTVVRDVNEALSLAKKESAPDDLIMVGGSTFVVAEVDGI